MVVDRRSAVSETTMTMENTKVVKKNIKKSDNIAKSVIFTPVSDIRHLNIELSEG